MGAAFLSAVVAFFVVAVIVENASVHCTGPGGSCSSGFFKTPAWGVPFELVVVLVAGALAWHMTAWLTPPARLAEQRAVPPRSSLPGPVQEHVLKTAWTGVALVGLSAAVPLVALRLFWWGCTDECHGFGFVVVGYFFVTFSGGLLLASAASVSQGNGVSPFVRLLAAMAVVVSILFAAITVLAAISFVSADVAVAIFWIAIAGVPGAAGLLAGFGVRRLAKMSRIRTEPLSGHFGLNQLKLGVTGWTLLIGIGLTLALLSLASVDLPLLLGVPFWLLVVWTIAWIADRSRVPRTHPRPSGLPEDFRPIVWGLTAIVTTFVASLGVMLVA